MSNILDECPYPWHKPIAVELYSKLMELYAKSKDTEALAKQAKDPDGDPVIDTTAINFDAAVKYVWLELLTYCGQHGVTRFLVQTAYDRLTKNAPQRTFLSDLLADRPPVRDTQPRGADGTPNFDDTISDPEALLYRDDLTIPIGRVPAVITTLQRLAELAHGVCKFTVTFAASIGYGTGFRIGPNLLLTNWHVFHDLVTGAKATAVSAEFAYDDDGQGGLVAAIPVKCDITTIVTNKTDDWAVICASVPLQEDWPIIPLSAAVDPVVNGAAYIIQHPLGNRKRIGFVRNQISDFDEKVVHYLTDTQEGASGSPVFDHQGRLIALHHAGGRPQEIVGRAPLKKNEGIRISAVSRGLTIKQVQYA